LNEPDDLRRCLTALETQKSEGIPFEVIVVDNGSRNLPLQLCSQFGDTRLEQEPTPGPGPARSRGAFVSRGEIVSFIDADCIADAGWIRGIVEFFDSNPGVHFIAGDVGIAQENPGRPTAFEIYESVFSYLIRLYVERDRYAATGNMSVRRDAFEAVGPFGGINIAEDREWGQRATAMGYRLAYVPRVRVTTPACKSFDELVRRWDRAIAHDFEDIRSRPRGMAAWILRSLAVAISPPFEIPKIIHSGKVSGINEFSKAFMCLSRVRLYRARKMLSLAFQDNSWNMVRNWNRE
jgi:cellulose synthase/poly-beta-1,6-N-acetylglucosamine synthase-like glycosyltransferase